MRRLLILLSLFSASALLGQTHPRVSSHIPWSTTKDETADDLHQITCRDRVGHSHFGDLWTWQVAGTFTNRENDPNLSVWIDGMTPEVAYSPSLWGTNELAEAVTVGMSTPSRATVYQSNVIAAYGESASSTTAAVGGYFHMRASGTGAKIWGSNPRIGDYDSTLNIYTGVAMIGEEIDVNAREVGTSATGLLIQGGSTVTPPTSIALSIAKLGTATDIPWASGIVVGDKATTGPGLYLGNISQHSSNSQFITFRGRDAAGNARDVRVQADRTGSVLISPTSGDGALNVIGVLQTNSAYRAGLEAGDVVIYNGKALYSDTAAHNAKFRLIGGDIRNRVVLDPDAQGTILGGAVTVGATGTAITQIRVFAPNISPSWVDANTSAEQTFAVAGLETSDLVYINPPSVKVGTGIVGVRVSAKDTLAITFGNFTAVPLSPASGIYRVVAIRN